MEILIKGSNTPLTCCSPYHCGYLCGYHGLTVDGASVRPEVKKLRDDIDRRYPPDDRMDFFLGAIYGERAAKEADDRITRAYQAKRR